MTDAPAWSLPEPIARLKDLAYNLWWSWHPEARALFKALDRSLWQSTHHSPVQLLRQTAPERLEVLSRDPEFLQRYAMVMRSLDAYLAGADTWFSKRRPDFKGAVAYFSAEFGVHNSLRIYSGGLGILAGDHCKSASDLGVPLVGVGFMYPQGYVTQRISQDGWQQNIYEAADWESSPVRRVMGSDGGPLILPVPVGSGTVHVAVWEVVVGRCRLLLMDTHVDANSPQDREISSRLYAGDRSMRLRQEIVLGIGGVRLLRAAGVPARAYHANEGHSAFLFLELIREKVAGGAKFSDALKDVSGISVFTTHTPVEAGHDVFTEEMIAEYFKDYWPDIGLSREQFLALGRAGGHSGWNMTALAMRLAGRRNAVSRRHGEVSRKMWDSLWPRRVQADPVPISHVTNGVHLPTWLNQDLGWAFDDHLGADWRERQDDPAVWSKAAAIPDEALWGMHLRNKDELFRLLRSRTRRRWVEGMPDPGQALAQGALMDPSALTIGFARRFAAYKRATLILSDVDRLKKLLLDPWRPVQLLFAGKAHPDDDGGKQLIQHIYRLARDPALGGRIAFVEDYDMHVARYLVQGCDVWLSNPQPPLEACGTSGMKAAMNGVPNLSVADGWWEEGFNGLNGWSVAGGGDDGQALLDLLEKMVVPLYYDQTGGIPHGWVRVMKEAIRSVSPRFCADRMVKEYVERLYLPSVEPAAAGSSPSGA